MEVDKLRELVAKWRESLNRCVGYPDCDGDLPGELHSEKCPESKRTRVPIFTKQCADELEAALADTPTPALGTCRWSSDSHVYEETCVDWKPNAPAEPAVGTLQHLIARLEGATEWVSTPDEIANEIKTALAATPTLGTPESVDDAVARILNRELLAATPQEQKGTREANENLADYLLRTPPPQWDYKEVLILANKVAAGQSAASLSEAAVQNLSTNDVLDGNGHMISWVRKRDVLALLRSQGQPAEKKVSGATSAAKDGDAK